MILNVIEFGDLVKCVNNGDSTWYMARYTVTDSKGNTAKVECRAVIAEMCGCLAVNRVNGELAYGEGETVIADKRLIAYAVELLNKREQPPLGEVQLPNDGRADELYEMFNIPHTPKEW